MSIDTKALRELLANATPGEWAWHWRADDETWPGSIFAKGSVAALSIAMCPRYRGPKNGGDWQKDAALITAMKSTLPALLDAADRLAELEAENGRLKRLLSDVTCVAITMLYDGHKQDVLNTFTVPELTDVVARTEHLQPERVEHIYRRGYDALAAGGDQ